MMARRFCAHHPNGCPTRRDRIAAFIGWSVVGFTFLYLAFQIGRAV